MTVNEALNNIYYSTSPLWSTPYAGVPRRLVTAKSYHFHPARVTIKHWQLRDLVSVSTQRPSLVYYPTDNRVNSIDLAASPAVATGSEEGQLSSSNNNNSNNNLSISATRTSKPEIVAEFGFEPRSIQNLGDIVGVAGVKSTREQAGKIGVVNHVSGVKVERELGQYINNSLCLYTDYDDDDSSGGGAGPSSNNSSAMHALVCNNDKNLYWLQIGHERIEIEREMPFPASLNHASISPDRKMIVACGDIGQVYISPAHETRATTSNIFQLNESSGTLAGSSTHNGSTTNAFGKSKSSSYQSWQTLETWPDYGFSTSFHSSGVVFGVAFQPGVAQLFDVRNLSEPLTQIYSTRPKDWTGAFRCLKFASGPQDLVFISEQMGRVHLVDLRNFENHQVLSVPDRTGRWQRDEEQPAVQFYEDMLKSGEALPLVMNDTVARNEHYPAAAYNGGGYATGDDMSIDEITNNMMLRRTRRLSVESATAAATSVSIGGSTGTRRGSASIRELSMDGVPLTPEPFDTEPTAGLLQGPPTRQRRYSLRYLSNRPDLQTSPPASSSGMTGLHSRLFGGSITMAASHLAAHTENGVSGLGWSDYNGGTLIVGTDCGVATWSIDQISRRTFPDYERR